MSQATEKAAAPGLAPIVKHIAPPFMGPGFSTYKSGPSNPGFWTAIRQDVTRGGIVVQLGADPNQPPAVWGIVYAGFQYKFTVPADPYLYYHFTARFNPGPVTIRQTSGNVVNAFCEAFVNNVPYSVVDKQRVYSNTPLTLVQAYFLQPGKTYTFQLSAMVWIQRCSPDIPYGEVIIKDIDVELRRYPYTNSQAVKGAQEKSAALMTESEPIIEEIGSIEEAQAKGLVGMF